MQQQRFYIIRIKSIRCNNSIEITVTEGNNKDVIFAISSFDYNAIEHIFLIGLFAKGTEILPFGAVCIFPFVKIT